MNSGAFASASEIVREAMRGRSAKWMQKREDVVKLRAMWEEGKASCPAVEVDLDTVSDEACQEIASALPTPVKLFWTPKARADVKSVYIEMGKEQPRSGASPIFAVGRNC